MKAYFLLLIMFIMSCSSDQRSEKPAQVVSLDTLLIEHIAHWEGYGELTNHPNDYGGLTSSGITKVTFDHLAPKLGFSDNDFYNMKEETFKAFVNYYDTAFRCNKINYPPLRSLFVESYWGSNKLVKKYVSYINSTYDTAHTLGSRHKGYPLTDTLIVHINSMSTNQQHVLLAQLLGVKKEYHYQRVLKDTSQKVFLKGWLNRTYAFEYLYTYN